MKTMFFETSEQWESWLEQNHDTETELWLVYLKKHTDVPGISYEESVQSALCWGWIDGLVKKLDEDRYARKFTPRKENSVWSESNKKRVAALLKEGKIKPVGLKKIEAAQQNGNWAKINTPPEIDLTIPQELKEEFEKHTTAAEYFNGLSKRHQKEYLLWIKTAKRPETRTRRVKQSIELLLEKKNLGLK
ncbi:YdeI/OmpD-associated family protein [Maribellus sp. YY47]|uniref:YdeI/OmpD-associated family protein n=1 Tax=Maribellus sp. YY47 TaxID=2929486 RepID=UPI002001901C|nr:YdeI/OmpD-associated family protein [Maribellus sp. YY47]MCK3683663.1 YdeI/OmpD-associated family protein [Maribellus sp. YY47]